MIQRTWLKKKRLLIPLTVILVVLMIPNHWRIPVVGATQNDWNAQTFWYEHWGSSVTHKGIDIFGNKGDPVVAANHGILLYRGQLSKGGNVVVLLGPEWKIHYYAHLDSITNDSWIYFSGDAIGTLGDSGNAQGKQPHVHFSIVSLLPYLWRIDSSTQGWKKIVYLNPIDYITE
ncbi:M23 family metallopeptidase [Pleionea sediminis]|uniref:M23 family metallopeptidase n=1 Tax=Pleionea sediminis TaxID=2569479 RepID=UPI0011859BE3|nr:M23 family metallopeptidase [Pleionea sediminis]